MYIYMTNGTYEFMKNKKDKAAGENMILMQNMETTLLLHETNGKTIFSSPRKFESIDSVGELRQGGFIVMNNIPVTDEGRPVFEYRFKNRAGMIEKESGFIAIRVLRPLNSDTYVILTQWDNEQSFRNWQNSKSFENAHANKAPGAGGDTAKKIFSGSSYVTHYVLAEEDN
ncbi:antibiotic biosynthesis monooxygenase [Peribacillus saganii]|uniref:Antibiotic biosynthesis monooxygenase n=1 Tax=Peribacillus saganii TaxID=2303992 RepID=A0A372LDS3_9BACI|nr:antibiotic biosynthesis monooxygenase [Peribacillus saganii]RFU64384.1 antibiotic biosynthesis monooxygenase [Peribacillus saganii]